MGNLLKTLNLQLPLKMRIAAMEVVEEGGDASWDNREVDEAEIAAFLAGGDPAPGKPGAPAKPVPAKPDEPPAKAGTSILVPVSLSIPIGKPFKYVEIEKLKIEGELKLEGVGEEGVVKTADVIGISLDKRKLSPSKKVEIDLKKLKELLLGEVAKSSAQSDVKVEPKLELKVGPGELNVALGVSVTSGWYTGSVKFVAVAKESGKDFEFANFNIAPIGFYVKPRDIELNGVKGKVSGKLTITVVLKPAWGAIGADIAQKVGRPVLTGLAQALTVEAAIVAGFVAAGAVQIFAYVKSVSEWKDVQACAKAAENGWLSFRSGFASVYGLGWADGGAAALRKSGIEAAAAFQQSRLKASRQRELAEHGRLPSNFDAVYLDVLKGEVAKNPDRFGLWVEGNFRRQILEGFLKAYEAEHGDDYQFKPNFRALRTLLGVK